MTSSSTNATMTTDIGASPSLPLSPELVSSTYPTGLSLRLASRSTTNTGPTTGHAPTYIQANLIILPSQYAADFRLLCARNPVPCPLLAESLGLGRYDALKSHLPGIASSYIAANLDLRKDFPRYIVYRDGKVARSGFTDVLEEFAPNHVAFLIGCSYSFEGALVQAGLTPVHLQLGRNVAMYRTNIPLCPAGVFTGSTMVVSMRPYRKCDLPAVREITRPYVRTHGEPVDWGWEGVRRLGIRDLGVPEWGDEPLMEDGREMRPRQGEGDDEIVPVFWGCGVTPQEAVRQAKLKGTVIGHMPGHMLVLDVRDCDILQSL